MSRGKKKRRDLSQRRVRTGRGEKARLTTLAFGSVQLERRAVLNVPYNIHQPLHTKKAEDRRQKEKEKERKTEKEEAAP